MPEPKFSERVDQRPQDIRPGDLVQNPVHGKWIEVALVRPRTEGGVHLVGRVFASGLVMEQPRCTLLPDDRVRLLRPHEVPAWVGA